MLRRFDPARLRSVLAVAVLVGVLAGLASALLQTAIGEPLIRDAIAIEEAHEAEPAGSGGGSEPAGSGGSNEPAGSGGSNEPAGSGGSSEPAGSGGGSEPELVSRSTQSGIGLFAGLGLSGAAFGVLFALVFWGLRAERPDPFRRALVAGAMLAGSLTLAPWLKYPPNPPAVGNPDSIDRRQALYVSLIALALALCLAGAALATRLRREGWPEHRRVAAVGLTVAVPLAIALAVLPPAPDAVDAPATLIWRFRLASLGGNLVLWSVLSVGVGLLAAEATRRATRPDEPPAVPGIASQV